MKAPTRMEWKVELHGWRKLWARIRRKPWAWIFEADVELDPTPKHIDGLVSFDFKLASPLTRKASGC